MSLYQSMFLSASIFLYISMSVFLPVYLTQTPLPLNSGSCSSDICRRRLVCRSCGDVVVVVVALVAVIMIIIMITTTTTTTTTTKMMMMMMIIALKSAVRDFWQSPHCAANCLQNVCSNSQGASVCKSRATHRALITCNMSCAT